MTATIELHAADGARAKRVLMISTGSRFSVGFPVVEQHAVEKLRQLYSGELEIYAESLDIVRFPSERYHGVFRDYLRDKYTDDPPDLIILIYVGNLSVAAALLAEIFPRVPVVATGLTEEELPAGSLGSRVTGIAQRSDPGGTLEAILRLQPELKRIVLIGGTADVDGHVMNRTRRASRPFAERIDFEVWDKRSMDDVLKDVTSLPPQTAVLFTRMFRDGTGRAVISANAAQSIARVSNAPVYVMADVMLGTGAVGGSAADTAVLGQRAGEFAYQILSGVEPSSLPFQTITQGVPVFDWRALKRWRISDSRLPSGNVVRFKPQSTWEQYRWYIIGALAIIAIQAAIIGDLLLHRARRRQAEAELRESHQFMELATKASKMGLWMRDLEKGEVWANAHLRSLFGFGPTDAIRFDEVLARIHPYDRGRLALDVEHAEKSGLPFEGEFRAILPDGSERWVETRGETFDEPGGGGARRLGAVIDITDRKRAEESLRESETRFRTVANTAPVMIWMSGTDKLCTFFNKGWLDFTGRTIAQELGNGWAEGVHREDFDRCLEIYANAFDARREFTMEYRLRRLDGEYRWVLDTGVPRIAPDGKFLGYIGCATDITERKRTEIEAAQQRAELAHIARVSTMGELAASLAHELNQPLTAILSNAQAAQRFIAANPADLEEVSEILKDIVQDNSRAGEVIRRMRAMVKKEELEFSPLDLGNVMSDVVLLTRSDAILHNIRVLLEINSGLSPVRGNKVQLQQVLLNLLLNAFDALKNSPADERSVAVQAEFDGANMLKVAVRDRGTGLSGDQLDKIFQPFYTTKRDGLGMGLSISRSIVEAHGGRLWAENNRDRGATFYFTLPTSFVGRHSPTTVERQTFG